MAAQNKVKAETTYDNNKLTIQSEDNSLSDLYEKEDNDSFDTANVIDTNIAYKGEVSSSDSDYYKFSLPQAGSFYIDLSDLDDKYNAYHSDNDEDVDYDYYYHVSLYSEDEYLNTKEIYSFSSHSGSNNSVNSNKIRLPKGNYYIKITAKLINHV